MQTGEESGTDFSQSGSGSSYDASGSLNGVGTDVSPSLLQQLQGRQNRESGSSGTSGNLGSQRAMLGPLMNGWSVGNGVEGAFGENAINPLKSGRMNGSVISQGSPAISSLGAMQPLYPRIQHYALLQPADMIRKLTPYEHIPWHDMYLQPVSHQAPPKRFKIDGFENGVLDSPLIPIDPPAGPDYVVEPGDGLLIDLRDGCTRKRYRTVDREGRFDLPEIGPALASGRARQTSSRTCNRCCGLHSAMSQPTADIDLRAEDAPDMPKENWLVESSLGGILRPVDDVVVPETAIGTA